MLDDGIEMDKEGDEEVSTRSAVLRRESLEIEIGALEDGTSRNDRQYELTLCWQPTNTSSIVWRWEGEKVVVNFASKDWICEKVLVSLQAS